jgi:hypothetical protein
VGVHGVVCEDKDLAAFIADVSFGGENLKIVKASK